MIQYAVKSFSQIVFPLIFFVLAGCSDPKQKQGDEYLIRVENSIITVSDFNSAFEIAKAAYPHNIMQQSDAARSARLRLVHQMTEEMILLERAKELGISITDAEVEAAVENIKADYPDTVFQQMLLENAISYPSWEKGLKTRLLMEKVLVRELGDQIKIGPNDLSVTHEGHPESDDIPSDQKAVSGDLNDDLIKNVLRTKAEKAYTAWVKKLRKRYTIEINNEQWRKIDGIAK